MAGIDLKANPMLSLHEQIVVFFTIRQGVLETDEEYLNKFTSRLKNLELAGGGFVLAPGFPLYLCCICFLYSSS